MRRSFARLFGTMFEVKGCVILGVSLNEARDAVEISIRRHGNAKARCPYCFRDLDNLFVMVHLGCGPVGNLNDHSGYGQ